MEPEEGHLVSASSKYNELPVETRWSRLSKEKACQLEKGFQSEKGFAN